MDDRRQSSFLSQQEPACPTPAQGRGSSDNRRKIPQERPGRVRRRVSLLVATLITLTLLGSMAVALHSLKSGKTPGTQIVTPTPTGTGKNPIVYSRTDDPNFSGQLAWSLDGKRLAALNLESVQIWDATTGDHLLTIPVPANQRADDRLAWSPNGTWLAVVSNTTINIVNAQTGALEHQIPLEPLTEVQSTTQGPYLSARLPESGGGIDLNGLVWSPDSRFLAITIFSPFVSQSDLLTLDPQTGKVFHRITAAANITVTSWSSDSTYLAAFVSSPSNQPEPPAAWVWNMSTYQVVFKQQVPKEAPAMTTEGSQLLWQPSSDILAMTTTTGIELWDVAHDTLLKSYTLANTGLLAWSPDGKYVALVTSMVQVDGSQKPAKGTWYTSVVALNIQSGQRVMVYQLPANALGIVVIAWSPNGKYIATGPGGAPAPILVLAAPS